MAGRAAGTASTASSLAGAIRRSAALALLRDRLVGQELLDRQRQVLRRVAAERFGDVLDPGVRVLTQVRDDQVADALHGLRGAACALLRLGELTTLRARLDSRFGLAPEKLQELSGHGRADRLDQVI